MQFYFLMFQDLYKKTGNIPSEINFTQLPLQNNLFLSKTNYMQLLLFSLQLPQREQTKHIPGL